MSAAEEKARLRAEFPGWSIVHSSAGRWWAFRDQGRSAAARRLVQHKVTDVDANTSEELHEKLLKADPS